MPLDVGRVTHLLEQMHRSEDDAGDPIDADKVLVTDGARGFTWEDYGGGSGGSGGAIGVTPPLTSALPPRTTPSLTGSMTPAAEGRLTDTSGDNRYSQGIAYLDGVVHHFYTEGTTEHAAGSAAYHRKSYDYGVTYETAASIYAGSGAGRHGNVEGALATSRGRLIVGLQDQDDSDPFDVVARIIFSDDGGDTWSSPYAVPNTFSGDCVTSALIELPDGRIVLFAYGEQTGVVGGNTFVKRYVSTDHGETFGDEQTVASSASRTYAEPRVVVTDGTIIVFMRSDTNVHTWRTASDIDATLTTWSAPADVVSLSGPPDVISPWPGAVFMVARNDNTVWRGRTAMSWDKGLTFTSPAELDAGETRELDGTALWLMGAGAVYAIYALATGPSDSTFYIRRFYDGYGTDHLGNDVLAGLTVDGIPFDLSDPDDGEILTYDSGSGDIILAPNVATITAASLEAHGAVGELVIQDIPAGSPLVFADIVQNEAEDALVYADLYD